MPVVMICADNSVHSTYALEYYLKFVHREGNTVKVVHCPERWEVHAPMDGPTPGRLMELQAEAKAKTEAIKENYTGMLSQLGIAGDFVALTDNEPWHGIVKAADELQASMIIIGTRGQGKLKRTLLGSVSDNVLHHANVPVLVCRHPKHLDGQQAQ